MGGRGARNVRTPTGCVCLWRYLICAVHWTIRWIPTSARGRAEALHLHKGVGQRQIGRAPGFLRDLAGEVSTIQPIWRSSRGLGFYSARLSGVITPDRQQPGWVLVRVAPGNRVPTRSEAPAPEVRKLLWPSCASTPSRTPTLRHPPNGALRCRQTHPAAPTRRPGRRPPSRQRRQTPSLRRAPQTHPHQSAGARRTSDAAGCRSTFGPAARGGRSLPTAR